MDAIVEAVKLVCLILAFITLGRGVVWLLAKMLKYSFFAFFGLFAIVVIGAIAAWFSALPRH